MNDLLAAVFPRSKNVVDLLDSQWGHVTPTCFPPKDQWSFDKLSGIAVLGCNHSIGRTEFCAVNSPITPATLKKMEGLSVDQRLNYLPITNYPVFFVDLSFETLSAVRDPLGQQEMYFFETSEFIYLSSSLDFLIGSKNLDVEIDMYSAYHYLLFGQPTPRCTLASGVKKIPAGHVLEITKDRPLICRRYYTPLRTQSKGVYSEDDKKELVEELDLSIAQTVSSSSKALLISGGIDSSYIAASLNQQNATESVKGYTVNFAEPYKGNETNFAKFACDHFGVNLKIVSFNESEAYRHFEKVLSLAEPASAWASLTHLHLTEAISADGQTGFVSGLGADEIFGGYSRFLAYYKKQRFGEAEWNEQSELDYFDSLLYTPREAEKTLFSGVPEFFSQLDIRKATKVQFKNWSHYLHTASFYKECRDLKRDSHFLELMTAHECQFRIPDLLFTSFETMSRNSGVSGSYPFLAPKIVELACGLSANEKFWLRNGRWQNKKLLKEIAALRLPIEIMTRPIGSYTTPINIWLKNDKFADKYRSLLMESKFWEMGLVSQNWRSNIDNILFLNKKPRSQRSLEKATYQSWVLVTLAAWFERWILKK